jgi:hypothetical protein
VRWLVTAKTPWPRPGAKPPTKPWPPRSWATSATKPWTTPQRQWLQRIANQTKAITIVDREALDDDLLFFKREGGGWPRLNRMFVGELDGVLLQFQREMWAT